jgi:hypothetical protein
MKNLVSGTLVLAQHDMSLVIKPNQRPSDPLRQDKLTPQEVKLTRPRAPATEESTSMGGLDVLKVLYVPTLPKNLSSTGYLGDVGHIIVFPDSECWIMSNLDEREVLATRKRDDQNGLDKLMTSNSSINVLQTTLQA